MIKKRLLFLSLTVFTATTGFAGDNAGGEITCKSASGRTTVEGNAGVTNGNGMGPANITFKIDEQILNLETGRLVEVHNEHLVFKGMHLTDFVFFDESSGVFSLIFKRSILDVMDPTDAEEIGKEAGSHSYDSVFELVSIPNTLKDLKNDKYSFKAEIKPRSTLDPRKSDNPFVSDYYNYRIEENTFIKLTCSLDLGL
jgi:hypothetical protein